MSTSFLSTLLPSFQSITTNISADPSSQQEDFERHLVKEKLFKAGGTIVKLYNFKNIPKDWIMLDDPYSVFLLVIFHPLL